MTRHPGLNIEDPTGDWLALSVSPFTGRLWVEIWPKDSGDGKDGRLGIIELDSRADITTLRDYLTKYLENTP